GDETALKRASSKKFGRFFRWLFRQAILDEFQRAHRAKPAHVADDLILSLEETETLHHFLSNFNGTLAEILTLNQIKHGQRRAASQRITAERAAESSDHRMIHYLCASRD